KRESYHPRQHQGHVKDYKNEKQKVEIPYRFSSPRKACLLKRSSVLWFVVLWVVLSFGAYFLPLPVEQKSLLVPILLVLIPTIVCFACSFHRRRITEPSPLLADVNQR
ncbi:MAG TPA: hypothetical protein VFS61_04030, partial [Anaerolineales bacterium]|nr:hypothetical protein [Anaerolineales bacterium]